MGESDSKAVQLVLGGRARDAAGDTDSESSDDEGGEDGEVRMTDEERRTLRRKIREMMDRVPETAELTDPEERRAKMRELLTKYELVVELKPNRTGAGVIEEAAAAAAAAVHTGR